MADFTYDGPVEAPTGRRLANMANWLGAAVSLALMVGVGIWGYRLVMRDVTGIPVVQAMEGPMRVAPEDPGGRLADHQGLAVNDVAGTGTATPVPDRLLLAPQTAGLSDEDVPQANLPEAEPRPSDKISPAVVAPVEQPELASSEEGAATSEDVTEETEDRAAAAAKSASVEDGVDPIQALADQIAADAKPLSDLEPGEDTPVKTELSGAEDDATEDTGPAPAGALVRSLRPAVRPQGLRTATLAAVPETPEAPSGPSEIDPDTLEAGTRLAQLGAYDSPETARAEWARFATRFGDYMEDKDMVIERASSGGRVFYRLRAHGFDDLSDARRFCAAFVAENADCIPVATR
ncbi:SPOR domain-containing protein [Salipiger mucosus]|uniref:SPOR domain-containing protein n=1 Tax=Salipiger mucosus DSM 16094 TaxID=1123237 RepID=S9S0B4_9RHOB|nr:SPOR domain-containing protein [Salipiger mucosus]EPX83650.1 hypothetical protein Salmuc_02259 [Salipiger mucosus DSM 16094]